MMVEVTYTPNLYKGGTDIERKYRRSILKSISSKIKTTPGLIVNLTPKHSSDS